jgi:hypothetical protein
MTDRHRLDPAVRAGTKLVIAGAALALTGVLSITALVVQLLLYDPPCEPVVAWGFTAACGVLRLLVLMTLPVLLVGLGLIGRGLVLRARARHHVPR